MGKYTYIIEKYFSQYQVIESDTKGYSIIFRGTMQECKNYINLITKWNNIFIVWYNSKNKIIWRFLNYDNFKNMHTKRISRNG